MLSNAFARSALPGSSLRSASPRVTASAQLAARARHHLRQQVGRLGRLEAAQLRRHRHQRAIVALLEQRLHERQRQVAAGADQRARDGGAHVGRRILQQRLQAVERRAPAARLARTRSRRRRGRSASLSSIDSRTSLPGALPAVATSVASASARRRGGVAVSPALSVSAFAHADSGGRRTPESRSRVIACSRAAGSPSRSAFAPPVSSQNARGVQLGGAAGRVRAQRRHRDRRGLLARERGLDPGERLAAHPLVAVAEQRGRRAGVGGRIGLRPLQPGLREGADRVARPGARVARGAQQRLLDPALNEQAGQRLRERRLEPAHGALAAQVVVAREHPAEVRDAVVAEQLGGRRRVADARRREWR